MAVAAILTLGLAAPGAVAQGSCQLGTATTVMDANNVAAGLFNTGGLFWRGGNPRYEVPKGGGISSVFAAGLWLGGTVDGDLRTAAATYADWEFWPGPLTDGAPPADCSAFDRIYTVSQADIDAYDATGTATPDLMDWPADLGAPVEDGDGVEGNYDLAAGDRPSLRLAAQTAWWVMNDAGNVHNTTLTLPIGMEVRVQAFAYLPDGSDDIPDFVNESTFYEYTLVYQGTGTFEEAYATLWVDGDVGDFNDDYVGVAPDVRLGYTYNADDDDEVSQGGYGIDPPAVGVFGIGAGPAETARHDGSVFRSGGFASPVSSVMYYNNNASTTEGNPGEGIDFYNYQRARWLDGTRLVFGGDGYDPQTGVPTASVFSGTPPTYWSERDTLPQAGTQPSTPGDRRFLQTFGPFTFEPGDVVVIAAGILWARTDAGGGALGSLYDLIDDAETLTGGVPNAPEPIFGNTLAPRTVAAPSNQPETLVLPVSNPGEAILTFTLEPGSGPGSAFLTLPDGPFSYAPGQQMSLDVVVDPDGAAPGTYAAEIVVRSNDRNVVSGAIPVVVTVLPPVAGEDGAAGVFALGVPVPNPVAGRGRVDFQTATTGPVRLAVLDLLGREVAVLVDEERPAGAYQAAVSVAGLPAGVYVLRLQAGADEATQRLTVVR